MRSSNKSIARVSKRGVVKARKSGKCKIYAKVKGRRAMKCTVTVISREVYNAKKLRTLILKKGKKLSDGKRELHAKTVTRIECEYPYDEIEEVWIKANKKNNILEFKAFRGSNSRHSITVTVIIDLTKDKEGKILVGYIYYGDCGCDIKGTINKLFDGKISGIYFKQFEGSYEHDDQNMVDNSPREPSSREIKYSTSLTNNAFKQFNLLLKKYGYSMNKIGFTKWSFNKEYESISFY